MDIKERDLRIQNLLRDLTVIGKKEPNPLTIALKELIVERNKLKRANRKALNLAIRYGGIDGDHHKAWVIDQMVRSLVGKEYKEIVRKACGDDEYDWEVGIAP